MFKAPQVPIQWLPHRLLFMLSAPSTHPEVRRTATKIPSKQKWAFCMAFVTLPPERSLAFTNLITISYGHSLHYVIPGKSSQRVEVQKCHCTHRLGGNQLNDGDIARFDGLGVIFRLFARTAVVFFCYLMEVASDVGLAFGQLLSGLRCCSQKKWQSAVADDEYFHRVNAGSLQSHCRGCGGCRLEYPHTRLAIINEKARTQLLI